MTVWTITYRVDRPLRAPHSRVRGNSQLSRLALRCSFPYIRKINPSLQINLQAGFILLIVYAELIPHAPNRLDIVAFVAELTSKLLNMRINRSGVTEVIVIPHVIKYLLT